MHVVIAGERSDGSVGANAAVLEAQSAKTTLFFMSESRKTARALSAEAKERIWPLYGSVKEFRNIFSQTYRVVPHRGTTTLKRLDYRTIPDGRGQKGRGNQF